MVNSNKSSSTGFRMINISLMFLLILCSFWVGTQYFAQAFDYHQKLGSHYNHLYFPWKILVWYFQFEGQYTDVFNKALSLLLMIMTVGLLLLFILHIIVKNTAKANKSLHGSAKWATAKDIKNAGLFTKKDTSTSVMVGAWEDTKGKLHYLVHSGPEHVLTYAPTRSGKGVGLVLPTLLMWTESTFVTDLKGELWQLTSGWRKEYANNKVLKFEPAAFNSVAWNPLEEIRLGSEYEIGDVQNLATLIVDPDGKG